MSDNHRLVDQVNQYLADVNGSASADALHVVFIGGNDIGEAVALFVFAGPAVAQQAIQNAVDSVSFR